MKAAIESASSGIPLLNGRTVSFGIKKICQTASLAD
jgi:hypothetical protein